MLKYIWIKFMCLVNGHDWTCKAAQDIPPTPEQLAAGYGGFKDYAKMYCKRCGHESELNDKL